MPGFRIHYDLDSATTFCPCKSSFTSSDSQRNDRDFKAWKKRHAEHVDTDAIVHHITDDGMRCLADGTRRTWTTKE